MNHWTFWAACRGIDPELFFSDDRDDQRAAKQVCASCPVLAECRADALATDLAVPYGVRGGLTANERRPPRKARPTLAKVERDEARRIARTLTDKGVSMREIAARVGVDKRTIGRWRRDFQAAA